MLQRLVRAVRCEGTGDGQGGIKEPCDKTIFASFLIYNDNSRTNTTERNLTRG
jgi:hypothetical protein